MKHRTRAPDGVTKLMALLVELTTQSVELTADDM